jgi:hypothetical protein
MQLGCTQAGIKVITKMMMPMMGASMSNSRMGSPSSSRMGPSRRNPPPTTPPIIATISQPGNVAGAAETLFSTWLIMFQKKLGIPPSGILKHEHLIKFKSLARIVTYFTNSPVSQGCGGSTKTKNKEESGNVPHC